MTRIVNRQYDLQTLHSLVQSGISTPIARAFAARGIKSVDDLEESWGGLLPPNLLEGTDIAAKRLAKAREHQETVCVVGDYDCDGATACTVAVRGLRMLGINVQYLVPDRVTDGYGLSPDIVDQIRERFPETTLIITVDNGVSAVQAIEHANACGMEVIVTDHHLPGSVRPAAAVIVNPNLPESTFPSKALAGVGVIFYVLLALRTYLRETGVFTKETQPNLSVLVDLVALGTVADVVKLDKNNRILVARGLDRIRRRQTWPGIAALFAVSGRPIESASVRDFGFSIGPRINAAGRLSTMDQGIGCLLSDSDVLAMETARTLQDINTERRELQNGMQEAAEQAIEALPEAKLEDKTTFCLFNESFNEGIVGLVASRLKEKHNRPVIVFARSETGDLKGSGRSVPGVHLRDTLDLVNKRIPGAILRFGGHAMAAGLTLKPEALEAFEEAFEAVVKAHADASTFEHVIYADGGLAPDEITEELVEAIDRQIWGQGFETPIFANEVTILEQRILKEAHSKLRVRIGSQVFDAIFFRYAEPLPARIKMAYAVSINEFRGQRNIQLVVAGVEPLEG